MIITSIFLGIFALCIILIIISELRLNHFFSEFWNNVSIVSVLIALVDLAVLLALGVGILSEYSFKDIKVAELQAEREALVYQLNHELWLGSSIGEFNKKIIKGQKLHENPWTSWLRGNYYMEIDPIDLSEGE